MKPHPADPISFIAGLVFVLIGVSYLATDRLELDTGTQWLLPLALIGLGIAGLAGSIAGARRTRNGNGRTGYNGGNGYTEPRTADRTAESGAQSPADPTEGPSDTD